MSFNSAPVYVFHMPDDRLVPIDLTLPASQAICEVEELDGRGCPEIVVRGNELECIGNRCHVGGIAYHRIFRWSDEGKAFVEVTREFKDYLDRDLGTHTQGASEDEEPIDRNGTLVAIVIRDWLIGDIARGWSEYETNVERMIQGIVQGVSSGRYSDASYCADILAERADLAELFFGKELPWNGTVPGGTAVSSAQ